MTQKQVFIKGLKEMAADNKRIHVYERDGQWIVRKKGSARAVAVYHSRTSAINKAVQMKTDLKTYSLVIHRKDGSILKYLSA